MSHQSRFDEFSDLVYIRSIPQERLFTMFFENVEPKFYEYLFTVGVLLIATLLILTFFITKAIDFAVRRCFKVSGTWYLVPLAVELSCSRKFCIEGERSRLYPLQISFALTLVKFKRVSCL